MRLCPICGLICREILYQYVLSNGKQQTVYACGCGMVYSTNPKPEDYSASAIYTAPNAIGSGATESDRTRLGGIVDTLQSSGIPKTAHILDVGCAQGGLLAILKERGFTRAEGLDPSPDCVAAVLEKGLIACQGDLNTVVGKFDLLILSHVLEHVENIQQAISGILRMLKPDGQVYIEVPDAQRYHQFSLPFLDFNSEHINHFDSCSLKRVLTQSGLVGGMIYEKTIQLNSGAPYPAIWTLTKRSQTVRNVAKFIIESRAALAKAQFQMQMALSGFPEVIVWGAGEYLAHIMPLLEDKKVVQLIDRNPAMWGRSVFGLTVQSPAAVRTDRPIVIAAIVAAKSIQNDIKQANLPNKVITLL